MKKIKLWGIVLLIIVITICFCVNYIFYEPTKVNAFVAAKIYKAPANNYFKDDNFYKLIVDAYNGENGTSLPYTTNLTDEQLKTIKMLTIDCETVLDGESDEEYCSLNTVINDISGLERLTSLNRLIIYNLNAETLDFSQNIELTYLVLEESKIKSLDVSKNEKLEELYVSYTQLTDINVSNNTNLVVLDVSNNKIKSLDVSKNEKLLGLYVSYNELTSINVFNNSDLEVLDVSENEITTLDLSRNTRLKEFNATGTKITGIDLQYNKLLKYLYLGTPAMYGMGCPEEFSCYMPSFDSYITNLDLSNNELLEILFIDNAPLQILDLSNNKKLAYLSASEVSLTSLDVSSNNNLFYLDITNSNINDLKLGDAPLESLNVSGTNISSLILNEYQENIYELNLSGTLIKEINLKKLSDLRNLYVEGSNLAELDVSGNTELRYLFIGDIYYFRGEPVIGGFDVTSINLENNINLEQLYICGMTLDNLDLTKNINLKYIYFSDDIYMYKGDSFNLNSSIKFPDGFKLADIEWINYDEQIIAVLSNGVVNALSPGESIIDGFTNDDSAISYNNFSNIYVVEITSNKYTINNTDDTININDDIDIDTIKNNINVPEGITLDIDLIDNKIYVKHGIDILKTFGITKESVEFDEEIKFDNEKGFLSNVGLGTNVTGIIDKIGTDNEVVVTNKDNEVLSANDKVGTGSKVTIKSVDNTVYEYTIVIYGDTDGDGALMLPDIMKIANYVYVNRNSLKGAFLEAADYVTDGEYNLKDIMKVANKIYKGGN